VDGEQAQSEEEHQGLFRTTSPRWCLRATEGRRRKSEGRKQKAEGSGNQKAEGRRQNAATGPLVELDCLLRSAFCLLLANGSAAVRFPARPRSNRVLNGSAPLPQRGSGACCRASSAGRRGRAPGRGPGGTSAT